MESITLEKLLQSRDNRQQRQRRFLSETNCKTLICLTVVMPGSVKINKEALVIGLAAKDEITKTFNKNTIDSEEHILKTGYEFYLTTDTEPLEAKQFCCLIEENHILGRLFDIDILDKNFNIISREQVGYEKRKCLLCDNEARFCMRNFTHTTQELLCRIKQLTEEFLTSTPEFSLKYQEIFNDF